MILELVLAVAIGAVIGAFGIIIMEESTQKKIIELEEKKE